MYILGVRLDLASKEQALAILQEQLLRPSPGLYVITTVNAEAIALARHDPSYRAILNEASLNVIDGAGVAFIARLRGAKSVPRLPGTDLVYDLARLCQAHSKRLFLLGAAPQVASAAGQRLRQRFAGLEVEAYSPPLSPSYRLPAAEERAVFRRLQAFSPHVLCVALGMPKQEQWIHHWRQRLTEEGVRLAVGVGGALSYVAGTTPRAPAWMRGAGLEWLYRLLRQPRQRFRRQATRLPAFLILASLEALRWRLRGERGGDDP